ncbi:MAG: hypothetical protein ABJA32_07845, partial [Ginsengibacter sp.]
LLWLFGNAPALIPNRKGLLFLVIAYLVFFRVDLIGSISLIKILLRDSRSCGSSCCNNHTFTVLGFNEPEYLPCKITIRND